jgi:hypothetical protein
MSECHKDFLFQDTAFQNKAATISFLQCHSTVGHREVVIMLLIPVEDKIGTIFLIAL